MRDNKHKYFKIIYIIEIQVVLLLLLLITYKLYNVEVKIKRTNQFLFDVLKDRNIEALSKTDQSDIIIGDHNAPVSIIMYSNFDCQYCKEFFETTYLEINDKYINKGMVKLVIRFLTPRSDNLGFFAAKCSQYAYKNNISGEYGNYIKLANFAANDSTSIKNNLFRFIKDTSDFNEFMASSIVIENISRKVVKAHEAGIFRTPSFIINGQVLSGNRKMVKFEELILEGLNALSCE